MTRRRESWWGCRDCGRVIQAPSLQALMVEVAAHRLRAHGEDSDTATVQRELLALMVEAHEPPQRWGWLMQWLHALVSHPKGDRLL